MALSIVLSCSLATSDAFSQVSEGSPQTALGNQVKAQIDSTAIGTYLAIRLTTGRKIRGYLTEIQPAGFTVRARDKVAGVETRTKFDAVQSVKEVKPTHTPAAAWIVAGVLVGAVVAVLVVYLQFLHNEGH